MRNQFLLNQAKFLKKDLSQKEKAVMTKKKLNINGSGSSNNNAVKRGASLRTPIRYCVFVQDNQEQSLEELNNLHDEFENRKDDLRILIDCFVEENRNVEPLFEVSLTEKPKPKPYTHNLLSSLRQVEYSFSEFQKAKKYLPSDIDSNGRCIQEIETASVLIFFFNALYFLKIVGSHTTLTKNLQSKRLLEEITIIRDHFAHSYEKDLYVKSGPKAFVDFQIQRGMRLDSIVLIDLVTGSSVGSFYFSFPVFYFSLRDIFSKLKDNPKLFI